MKKHFENPACPPPSGSPFWNCFSCVYLPSMNRVVVFTHFQFLVLPFFTEYISTPAYNFPYSFFFISAYYRQGCVRRITIYLTSPCSWRLGVSKFWNHKYYFINCSYMCVISHVFEFFCGINTQTRSTGSKGVCVYNFGRCCQIIFQTSWFFEPSLPTTLQAEC